MSSFNFLAAINGEPIYCNGIQVYPIFSLTEQMFGILAQGQTYITWQKDGTLEYDQHYKHNLTTDPPKKNVKKTVWVCIAKFLTDDRKYDTSLAYNTKEEASSKFNDTSDLYIGTYPIEIEVEG